MKSTGARRLARSTLGATRPWIAAGCATAQWKARFARRYSPPLELLRRAKSKLADQPLRTKHHHIDPRSDARWLTSNRNRLQLGIGRRLLVGMPGRLRRNPHYSENHSLTRQGALQICRYAPCVMRGRTPAEAHHVRFAQPRALNRKVSDEYTGPSAASIIASCTDMAMKPRGGPA